MTVSIANAWSGTFTQPSAIGPMPPALQSTVIALTPANSVGGGSGTPTSGNWLFAVAGWNQNGLPAATVGDGDDIHSFWRPGDVTKSLWAVSPSAANTRTSVWYTANLARAPGDVYTAPNGVMAGTACLIVEVAGLGPWDVVTGVYSNYAAAATSLNLALAAPSAQAFLLGAVTGDNTSAGQAFAPASWTTLPTVTAGTAAELTSAWIVTSGSISVNGTATSAEDMSGVVIGVLTSAPSPVPGGANANWAGRTIYEFAPGSGFQTPPDQMTWVTLSDSAAAAPLTATATTAIKRAWSWNDRGGIPVGLGQLQSSSGSTQLDNFDGSLSPSNPGSPWYSNALNANMSFNMVAPWPAGVTPWAAVNGAAISQDSAHVYATAPVAAPNYSMKVVPNGSTAAPGAQSEQVAVTANAAYSASAWFYSVAGWATGAQVAISWYNSSHTLISTVTATAVAVPAATWTQVTLLGQTAPGTAAYAAITVQFAGTPAAAPFWVAEAALASGPSAVTTGLITAGVPVRVRMALGVIEGVTYNRWYCVQRFATAWTEKRTGKSLRFYVETGLTDGWSVAGASCPSPYRGEVRQDAPYMWIPCDDQPRQGGVLPTSLANAAIGNTNTLNIAVSPNGTANQDVYSTTGTDLAFDADQVSVVNPPAIYAVAQSNGWMYGDPASSPGSTATGSPVTAQPGSYAVTFSGQGGNTGSNGWWMYCNDSGFPALSGAGATVEGWFNYQFLGGAAGLYNGTGTNYDIAQQPVCPLTLWELATGSNPVAVLQLDSSGHLNLITYNGASGTSNSIYTGSDLRAATWFHVAVKLTATTWAVYVNGGATAAVSGSATGMSNFTWLIVNGDLGSNGGSTAGTGLVHGANMSVSHLAVYPSLLPLPRIQAHYWAAVTGHGLIPAPQSMQISTTAVSVPTGVNVLSVNYTPDGGTNGGATVARGYGQNSAPAPVPFAFSGVAVAVAGSYMSGPSAWSAIGGIGAKSPPNNATGVMVYVQWAGLAQEFNVYSASQAGTETESAVVVANSESFLTGYGSSASVFSPGGVASGSGASPPTGPSSIGDSVAQRIERLLAYGSMPSPMRAIDPAPLLVQAAIDIGGQQCGSNVTKIVQSDGGLLYVANTGLLHYRQRPHLAADTAVWQLGPNTAGGQLPYDASISFPNDPQKVWTVFQITPYSPDNATLPLVTPTNAAAVNAAEVQYGAKPYQLTSYLQSTAEMQNQVNWAFGFYGTLRRRAESVVVDAAAHPAAWGYVAGANVSDLCFVQDQPFGPPVTTGTYRLTSLSRTIAFGANGQAPTASIRATLEPEPSSYWS